MNSEESRFRDLLNEPPFDGSYRKEHHEQLREQVLEAFDASRADLSRRWVRPTFPNWRAIMSRPVPRVAAIVLAMVTAFVVFSVMFRTQSTIAFDSLIGPILNAKTARFNMVIEAKDLPKQTVRTLVLEPNRLRQEMPTGQISIFDNNTGRMLSLMPAQKSAMLVNMTDRPRQQQPANYFDHLRTNLRAADHDASSKREPLGRKQIAGRDAIGFRVKRPNGEMTVWGDPETGLPILVEMKSDMLPDGTITMTDFEFDLELDEALFKTEPPEGYSLQEFNLTTPAEKDLIGALKLLSDDNEGRFPDTFGQTAISAFIANWVRKNPGQPNAASTKTMVNLTLPLTQGLTFAATLPTESNARYAGKEIKYGDATSAVFWYKPAGASTYRVIYGDLSVKEQNAAPESPHAVPVTLRISTKDAAREILKARGDQPVLPLPQPPASPRKAQVEPTAPGEPEPKANDPTSQRILDRMAKAYADCTSYRDSGVVTTRFVRESGNGAVLTNTDEKPFMTAFARPDRFRFEYKDMKYNPPSRYIIWSQGTEVQAWWDIKPGIEKPASLRMAVGAANGVSGSSALTIPALLLPSEVGGGKLSFITDASPAEDDSLDAVECFRVAGRYAHNPIEVWIDKKSYQVRRIDERMKFDDFRTEQTTTYDPTIDEKIADKLLEFDPPVEN